jgi:hypothetical protein
MRYSESNNFHTCSVTVAFKSDIMDRRIDYLEHHITGNSRSQLESSQRLLEIQGHSLKVARDYN